MAAASPDARVCRESNFWERICVARLETSLHEAEIRAD